MNLLCAHPKFRGGVLIHLTSGAKRVYTEGGCSDSPHSDSLHLRCKTHVNKQLIMPFIGSCLAMFKHLLIIAGCI